ncbi:thiol-disulfide oxidoreductase DCC family protein [Ovoidimarina sediminis]|uniref:thiol-disulfide oxidoreductase DCC family protein n=1 Tax=Ovoidimarina sediminis TaxID=3079856 RepID=UPI002908C3BD|nr:DUF393 domain-containing protein [Rhodophyticola sp. MJ-SS7]MDU8943015.1 DUF393 domain-containing protein [Rhodophyticola sp. MJ-SS7]
MSDHLTVIYNGSCPICSREVALYRSRAEEQGADLNFVDLSVENPARYGLTRDDAARRLYVARGPVLISGIDAFALIWGRLDGYRWLAGVAQAPGLRPVMRFTYDRIAAPALYRWHRSRRMRQAG